MLPLNKRDRVGIVVDDHRLVAREQQEELLQAILGSGIWACGNSSTITLS